MQRLGHRFTLGLALRQQATQHLTRLVSHATVRKTCQVLASKPIMQQRHGFVGGRQRRVHIRALENQCVIGRVKFQGRMERLFVGHQIRRLIALQQHLARLQGATGQPATQRQRTGQRGFGALSGGGEEIAVHRQNQRITFG